MKIDYYIKTMFSLLRAAWFFRRATHLGKKVRVWGNPAVKNWGRMIICDRVRLESRLARTELVAAPGATLEIGESVFINYGCSISAAKLVHIGAYCSIGPYVMIVDTNFHCLEPERRNESPEPAPVFLEENVWLGARAIILPGVRIGTGSVIGAGSIVTRDIPPRVLAAGNPAKVIRDL